MNIILTSMVIWGHQRPITVNWLPHAIFVYTYSYYPKPTPPGITKSISIWASRSREVIEGQNTEYTGGQKLPIKVIP